ncbi:SymE family type I addiction module toxin [Ruminiclostridium cellobioparum]|nr:SymE family type I addiction module toxin [Ruminiclostridium cellobioparum]
MQARKLTVYSTTSGNAEVPQIRIQGKWLEKIGFQPNSKIIIEKSTDN